MRETAFIEQNKKKWQEFEEFLDGRQKDPEKLQELFVQVTDDLSYARTFYPNRSVRVYLNGLAQRIYLNIYKGKRSRKARFLAFWENDIPWLLYESRRELQLSLAIFLLAMGAGILSCAADAEFLRTILGDQYVEMTEANIRSGDPMAVYKEKGAFNMFLGITLNNMLVAFKTFITGIFYGIGTLGILLYNGVMLGAFQYFFVEKGLFQESFLTIWMHGCLEIPSIVIAGAAGLTMGRGLVFPGTLTRLRSFQLSARRGISVLITTAPLFIIAGFTESYITRHTELPDLLRGSYIATCLLGIAYFYFYYPRKRAAGGSLAAPERMRLLPGVNYAIDPTEIKTAGVLFTDTFLFMRSFFRPLATAAAGGAALYCAGAYAGASVAPFELFYEPQGISGTLLSLPQYFQNENNPWLFPLTTLMLTLTVFTALRLVAGFEKAASAGAARPTAATAPVTAADFAKLLVVGILLNLVLYQMGLHTLFLTWFCFPLLFLWGQHMLSAQTGLVGGLLSVFQLAGNIWSQLLGLSFTWLLCGMLFLLILDAGLLWFLLEMAGMNFFLPPDVMPNVFSVARTFLTMFVLMMLFGMWAVGTGLQFFSAREAQEATFLKLRLQQIGKQPRIRGLEREGGA
ncbi:MAG: hypothetical protein RI973_1295 [Bacteroidota bacterium]|jgi:uncharacterized membrane protein SpoIIM required for sporulation